MKRFFSFVLTVAIILGLFENSCMDINAVNADALKYKLNNDGSSYSVVDCSESATGEIVIPDFYNDLPVTGIGNSAFKDCNKLKSVVIGDKVTKVGDYAFNNCASLETVKFPENDNYNKFKTAIVNDCQNISDWTDNHTSNCEIDTDNFVLGTQSIHSVNGTMVCTQDTYDMLNNNLVLKLRINSMEKGACLYMQVLNNTAPTESVVYELMRGGSTTPVGEWREITVPYTGYAWGKSDNIDFTSINYIKIYTGGGNVDWNLQYVGLKPVSTDKGIISFTFDDGYKSQYTGLKILGEKGIKGTLFYIPEANTNGSDYYLKIPDLQELVKLYGADIEVHGASSYNDKTDEELVAHWKTAQKLLKDNGLGEGRHMSYPNGMHEERVVNLAKNYFDSCRTIQYYIPAETYLPGDNYRIRAISSIGASGNNVEYIKDKIDKAMDSNSWLVLVFHRIEDGNTTMYCSESELASIADYALSSGAEIKTVAEVMDSVSAVENSMGLKSIGKYAFYSCPKLKAVSIPDSVQQIGEKAFGYYYNAESESCAKTDDFVVSGWKNSGAQIYAQSNDFLFGIICNHIDSNWVIHTESTCTECGLKQNECIECGEILETAVIPAKGHTFSDWIIDKVATVSVPGSKYRECTFCKVVLEKATIAQLKPATSKTVTTNEINGINITWNAVEGAVKYNVYRRQGGYKTWTLVGTTIGTTITDTKVTSGIYYCYSVRAYNNADQYSDYISANTNTRKFMATPKLTSISNATNGLQIKWNAVNGGGRVEYRVYRRGAGSTSWTYLGTTTSTTWTDAGVKNANGGYYRYTVRAVQGTNGSGWYSAFDTNGLYLKRLANPTLKSAVSSKSGITVKWGAINGTTGYYVYRKTANSGWVRIASVGGTNNTTYLDKTAKKGVTYVYTVRAVYGSTTSYFNSGISCKDKY